MAALQPQPRKQGQEKGEAEEVMYPVPNSNNRLYWRRRRDPYATEHQLRPQQQKWILAEEVRHSHSHWHQGIHPERHTRDSTARTIFLPSDIIVDILSRLPAKSLLRLRCVCKDWQSLTCDLRFLKAQHKRALDRPASLMEHNPIKKLILYDLEMRRYHTFRYKIKGSPVTSDLSNVMDGLVCIYKRDNGPCHLLNPTTRESVELPISQQICSNQHFGLGYDESIAKYKLVRMYMQNDVFYSCEVLTLGKQEWRCAGEVPSSFARLVDGPIFANGSLYWLILEGSIYHIYTFDIKDENFGHVSCPVRTGDSTSWWLWLLLKWRGSVCVAEYCISTDIFEIWMLKDPIHNTWTKECSFTVLEPIVYVLPVANDRIHLVSEKNMMRTVIYSYDVRKKTSQKVKYNRFYDRLEAYTESLISPGKLLSEVSND